MTQKNVAFIGLGNMGGPMAANLTTAGYRVLGSDPSPAAREKAAATGVDATEDAAAVAAEADVVITMLPNGEILKSVYDGDDGVLAAARPGTLLVDCSTVDVEHARQASEMAEAAGHRPSLDAPVSGGIAGAAAGTLTFMVGGGATELEEARPLLEVMGRSIVHCGDSGAGQAVKMCNNMVLAVSTIAVSEAFVLAESLGVDHQVFFDVASTATAQCWSLNTNCPVPGPVPASPANRDYAPGFAGALMAKDLRLAQSAIEKTGTAAQFGTMAAQAYARFAEEGGGDKDFSAIINRIRAAGHGSDA